MKKLKIYNDDVEEISPLKIILNGLYQILATIVISLGTII